MQPIVIHQNIERNLQCIFIDTLLSGRELSVVEAVRALRSAPVRARQSVLADGRVDRARSFAWDVSSRHSESGEKGASTLEPVTEPAGDRTVTLQCPRKHGPHGTLRAA